MNKKYFYSVVILALYVLIIRNDYALESMGGIRGSLWLSGGVALAAIYTCGWPMTLVVFAASMLAHLSSGASLISAGGWATSDSIEVFMGAAVLRAVADFEPRFSRLKSVYWFLFVAVLVCPFVDLAIDLPFSRMSGGIAYLSMNRTLLVWWAGKVAGVLAAAPLFFIAGRDQKINWSQTAFIEVVIFCVLLGLIGKVLFIDNPEPFLPKAGLFQKYYLLFPLLSYAALRFKPRGVSLIVFALSTIALISFSSGARYVSTSFLVDSTEGMQLFVITMASSSLIFASAIAQANASEEKFKSMFFKSGVPMAQVASDGRFMEVNQKFCELLGYSREKLLTSVVFDLTHPDDRRIDKIQFEEMYKGKLDSFHREKRYLRSDGTEIWVYVDAAFISGGDESEPFALGVVRDISKIKQNDAEIELSRATAVAANSAKSIFLANMSHEIRTPLGVILGFVELLRDENLESAKRARYLETIHRNAVELGRLIDDVLDLSKIEAGRLELNKERVFPRRIIEDLRQTFEASVSRKRLRLDFVFASDVSEVIFTDPLRLRQILVNIVGNAIKFTSFGGITVEFSQLAGSDVTNASTLVVTVKDTGCGIAELDKAKLFVPFGQASRSTKNYGGTGLGLVLSKRLAGLLGGDLVLTASHVGIGSTFTITIDAGMAAQQKLAETPMLQPKGGDTATKPLTGRTILVAEDTPDQATLIQLLLVDQGATVEVVANGAQAIEKVSGGQFDAVLMDMQMPVMDGFAATRRLRALGFRQPIIALTAQAMREDQEKCIEAGCDTHIAKPFTQKVLVDRILSVLT